MGKIKGTIMGKKHDRLQASAEDEARRQFLARCGRFAVVTPPAMALLVSVAAAPEEAHASTILGKDKDKNKNKNKDKNKGQSWNPFY